MMKNSKIQMKPDKTNQKRQQQNKKGCYCRSKLLSKK